MIDGLERHPLQRLGPSVEPHGPPVQPRQLPHPLRPAGQPAADLPLARVRHPVRHPERRPQQFLRAPRRHQRPAPQPAEGHGPLFEQPRGTPFLRRDPDLEEAGTEPREIDPVRPRIVGHPVRGHRERPVEPRALRTARLRGPPRHHGPQRTRIAARPHAPPLTDGPEPDVRPVREGADPSPLPPQHGPPVRPSEPGTPPLHRPRLPQVRDSLTRSVPARLRHGRRPVRPRRPGRSGRLRRSRPAPRVPHPPGSATAP